MEGGGVRAGPYRNHGTFPEGCIQDCIQAGRGQARQENSTCVLQQDHVYPPTPFRASAACKAGAGSRPGGLVGSALGSYDHDDDDDDLMMMMICTMPYKHWKDLQCMLLDIWARSRQVLDDEIEEEDD
eukprot:614837-Rhodomonas_salina.1